MPPPDGNDTDDRRESVEVGRPYARIRVIAAILVFLFAITVIAVRGLSG